MGGGLVVSLIVSFISLVKTSELNTPGLQGKSSWYHENPWEISDFISCANAHLMVCKRCKISCGPDFDFRYAMALNVYGPKAAGREKSGLRVTKQPSLQETSWPNGWSQQLALLDSWQSLWREYAQEISPSWDHF